MINKIYSKILYINTLVLILIFNQNNCFSEFVKIIGEKDITEFPIGIFQIEDNLLLSVTSVNNYANINEILVQKFDTLGNELNTNKIQMNTNFYLSGIDILNDSSGFILSGNYETNFLGKKVQTGFILKMDKDGNKLWMQDFLFNLGTTLFYKTNELEDGTIVIAGGLINPLKNNLFDYLIIKTNSVGELLWYKSYGTYGNEVAKRAVQTKDGDFILSGDSNGSLIDESYSVSLTSVYVMGLDSLGEFKWHYFIGNGNLSFGCQEHIITKDDNVVICGEGVVDESGSFDYLFIKIDKDGKILNKKTIGTPEFSEAAFNICEFSNGNFGVVGYENSTTTGFVQRFIYYLLDSEFNIILKHRFTNSGRGQGNYIGLGKNESVLMAGTIQNLDIFDDGLICYLNSQNKLVTSVNYINSTNYNEDLIINLFPNPCFETFNIKSNISFDLITVYNSLGECKGKVFLEENNEYNLNTNDYFSGLYYLKLSKNNNYIGSQSFFKSK